MKNRIVVFAGQYYDDENGLSYNYYRYYGQDLGRYNEVDPIGFWGGDENLYSYVQNDPANRTDPLGLRGAARRPHYRRDNRYIYYRVRALENAIQRYNPGYRYQTIRSARSRYNRSDIEYLERQFERARRNAYKEACRIRSDAVKEAWRREADLVRSRGYGTRPWTPAETLELLRNGKVSGYHGHHINSLKAYPEFAGEPYNIIFLTPSEHLQYGHGGNWRNPSVGDFVYR